MPAEAHIITDHEQIRHWVEERGGKPGAVKRADKGSDSEEENVCMISIRLPGHPEEAALEDISWDEWFRVFEQDHLAFICQEETSQGDLSHRNRLVDREHF